MSFNIATTLTNVKAYLTATNRFKLVETGFPHLAIPEGFCAFVGLASMHTAELTLSRPIEVHTLRIRITRAFAADTFATIELEHSQFVSQVMDALYGDADLGATVRNIDFGGQYGEAMQVVWSDEQIPNEGPWFRVADITLPLVVDSSTATAL